MRAARAVAAWPRSQRTLRAVVLLGPVVALLATGAGGQTPPGWLLLVVLGLSVVSAASPGSGALTLVVLVVLGWWARSDGDLLHPAVLGAALALAAAHVAALLVAAGPPETPVDARVVRLWLRRAAVVLSAAPLLWVAARGLRDGPAPAGLWPAGLVVVLLAATAASTAFPRLPDDR